MSWKRLLETQHKMPWELSQQDIEQHADWMSAQGYARSSIANEIGSLSSFYDWCAERQIDPECGRASTRRQE